ncbi:hypothetical protein BJ322DRAFT_1195005 [Thelephora terrestris]|uniref:Uncharacterized protein n=1 Tax=Thelephora terrestris TaxID=56493 RepID=A0A9P6HCY2_9AGAM|nr:hypothetical protein BJ322DRAFT_1195005 [Thelephora terrestris]
MSARYAPLPTQRPSEHSDDELDVAFDGSDDELDYDDDNAPVSESQPLDPSRSVHTSPPLSARNHPPSISIPGAYDFERVDYDVPPPGSPPERRRTITGTPMASFPRLIPTHGGLRNWFSRTAANVLHSHYVRQFGLGGSSASAAIRGGDEIQVNTRGGDNITPCANNTRSLSLSGCGLSRVTPALSSLHVDLPSFPSNDSRGQVSPSTPAGRFFSQVKLPPPGPPNLRRRSFGFEHPSVIHQPDNAQRSETPSATWGVYTDVLPVTIFELQGDVVGMHGRLTVQEHCELAVAYRRILLSHRAELQASARGREGVCSRAGFVNEMHRVCAEFLETVSRRILPVSKTGEEIVYCWTMWVSSRHRAIFWLSG